MNALGLRAHPKRVTFAVVGDADPPQLRAVARLRLPAALHPPEQLSFVRTTLLDLIREFEVTCAGVRTTEPVADQINVLRVNIEGVIQELLGAGAVPRYFAGPLATMGGLLGTPVKEVKQYAKGERELPGVDGWGTRYDLEEREALLAALAALRIRRSRLTALTDAEDTTEAGAPGAGPGADGVGMEEGTGAD